MADIKAVEHVAEIRQVKTMADGTFNVILNLPEYCVEQSMFYMKNNRGMVKVVGVLVEKRPNETTNENGKIHI